MAYLNQPNRVYISSDDARHSGEHSGNFNIKLDDPIQGAKTVNVVSCEYPTSFYNILSTDTFSFDEVYRDNNGVERKRIRFSLSGIDEGNYTSTELATALSNKLSYSATAPALLGVEVDKSVFLTGDITNYGVITASGASTIEPTNRQMFIKEIIEPLPSGNRSRFHNLEFDIKSIHMPTNSTAYGFLIERDGSLGKVLFVCELKVNNKFWDGASFDVDLVDLGLDIPVIGGKKYDLGLILPVGAQVRDGSRTATVDLYRTIDEAQISNITEMLTNPFINFATPNINNNFLFANDASLTRDIAMYVKTVRTYDHSYNHSSTINYSKAELQVAYDAVKKKFSIVPAKDSEYRDAGGSIPSADTMPFYKNLYPFLYNPVPSNMVNLNSYLEIPVINNDKTSINYMLGSRGSLPYITSSNLSANTTLLFPHIPRLIRYPYLYLTCDFVNDSCKSGVNQVNILQKLPLTTEYGNLNFFNVSATDSSVYCNVSRDELQTIRFTLVDKNNNIVDLNGGEISFTLNFEY